MTRNAIALFCGISLIAATAARAQNLGDGLTAEPDQSNTRVGTRGATFLEIPVGARAQALGGAGAAMVEGVEALAWNIAAIASSDGFGAGWSYSELFDEADITHQFLGVIIPVSSSTVLGLSVTSLSSGDILRTTERFPNGGDPVVGNAFDFNAVAVTGAWGQAITDRLNLGAGVKFVQEGIDDAHASWIGVDVGALFRTGLLGTVLGVSIQNIGGEASFSGSAIESVVASLGDGDGVFPTEDNVPVEFSTTDVSLPTLFRFSVAFDVAGTPEAWLSQVGPDHDLRLVADLLDGIGTALEPTLALEYSFREILFGRAGKHFFNEDRDGFRDFADGASLGGGIKIPGILGRNLGLDYAYTDMGLLENIQTISIHLGT